MLGISISNSDEQNKLTEKGWEEGKGSERKKGWEGERREGGKYLYFTASEKRPSKFIEEDEI